MFKFIIPALIIFLVVLFWEKIKDEVYKRFNIKINYIIIIIFLLIFGVILSLLYF